MTHITLLNRDWALDLLRALSLNGTTTRELLREINTKLLVPQLVVFTTDLEGCAQEPYISPLQNRL